MKKRRLTALVAAVLLLTMVPMWPTGAQTVWVYTKNGKTLNLRDECTNKVIGHIPYGTKLETDPSKDAQTAAYVTYKGVSGYAKWEFLVNKKPPSKSETVAKYNQQNNTAVNTSAGTSYTGTQYTNAAGEITVASVGAYIQAADSSGKGYGAQYGSVTIQGVQDLVITADVPRGQKVDYWVINGVRYDFNERVKTILLKNIDQSFTFEAVPTRGVSQTLLSPSAIQAARTGQLLEIETVNAQLCHVTQRDKGAGGWMKYFNFTSDYYNRATGQLEMGGQITARVKAQVPKGRRVRGWKFDETELYFNSTITNFIVRTLNDSMKYEPIFSSAKKKNDTVTRQPVEPNPTIRNGNGWFGVTLITPTPNPGITRPKRTVNPGIITPSFTRKPTDFTVLDPSRFITAKPLQIRDVFNP